MIIAAKSANLFRLSAAITPSGMPMRQVASMAAMASSTVYGSEARMTVVTLVCWVIDIPKLPVTVFLIKV